MTRPRTGAARGVGALVTAAVLATTLAGCGDDKGDKGDNGDNGDRAASAQALLDAQTAAVDAAKDAAAAMTTYDYRTVKKDFAWVDTAGTEAFQTYFADSRKATIPYVRRFKVVATGKAIDAAGTASDPDHVHVVLFVDQKIQVAGQKGTKIDQPRVTMDMVRQDGQWLVDQVAIPELVGSGE